jgi:hypothetical protein
VVDRSFFLSVDIVDQHFGGRSIRFLSLSSFLLVSVTTEPFLLMKISSSAGTVGNFCDPTFPPPVFSVYECRKPEWVPLPESIEHMN